MYAAEMMERKQIRRVNRAKAQKQQQERKKLLLMILMTILIVFGIGFGFGTLFTRAQEPEQDSAHKYFTSIEIEKGVLSGILPANIWMIRIICPERII